MSGLDPKYLFKTAFKVQFYCPQKLTKPLIKVGFMFYHIFVFEIQGNRFVPKLPQWKEETIYMYKMTRSVKYPTF